MKEVEIHAWCDQCYADAEVKSEAVTHQVRIDGDPMMELELCDLHDKELLEPLRRLIAERGSPPARKPAPQPKTPAKTRTPAVCPIPTCRAQMLDTSIVNHIYQVHGRLGPDDPRPKGRPENITPVQWAVDWVTQQNGAV